MNYLFSLRLKKRLKPFKPVLKKKPKLLYNPNPTKIYPEYESGFLFPATKRLTYVEKLNVDDLEF